MREVKKRLAFILTAVMMLTLFSCGPAPARGDDDPPPAKEYVDALHNSSLLELTFDDAGGFTVSDSSPIGRGSFTVESVLSKPAYQDEAVAPAYTERSAVRGKALAFDGYSNYIDAGGEVGISGSGLTADVCVAPRSFAWSAPQSPKEAWSVQVIAGQFDKAAKRGFLLGMTKFGYLTFQVGTGSEWLTLYNDDPAHNLKTYEWAELTAVYDGRLGAMCLYKNGALIASRAVSRGTSVAAAEADLLVGASNEKVLDSGCEVTMYNGLMDELKIYGAAMTAAQVAERVEGITGGALRPIVYEDAALSAEQLAGDYYRPLLHAAPPQNWMNEPHALFRYANRWHLFYQYNVTGPYWRQICWGHWVSDDMLNWRHVKEALIPAEGSVSPDGVWSGNMTFDGKGNPVLFFTAGDDSRPVNGSNQHIGIARPKDLSDPDLTEWVMEDALSVAQTPAMGTAGEFRDPQIFYEDGVWYMLVGGANNGRGTAHILKTSDDRFTDWEYMGEVFAPDVYYPEYGSVWELPSLVPLPDEAGMPTGKYLFIISPAGSYADNDVWYWVGDFDKNTCRFTPDFTDARLMDYGNNVFTGPSVFTDPDTGKLYIVGIMQDQRSNRDHLKAGWAHTAAMPRELYLRRDGTLGVKAIPTAGLVSGNPVTVTGGAAKVNESLPQGERAYRLDFKIELSGAARAGFRLKKSGGEFADVYLEGGRICVNTTRLDQRVRGDFGGALPLGGGTLSGSLIVDGALIEGYFDETKTLSAMAYGRGAGIEVYSEGGDATFEIRFVPLG